MNFKHFFLNDIQNYDLIKKALETIDIEVDAETEYVFLPF